MVTNLARAQLPAIVPCDAAHFDKCMSFMDAALPRRKQDGASGKLRAAAERRALANFSAEAMSYLAKQAVERCQWFPTISECLTILEEWKQPEIEIKRRAELIARNELNARLDENMDALKRGKLDGEQIAALPARHRDIAQTRGLIYADPDGTYRPRPDPMYLAMLEDGR